jgi:hypothetical protein
MPVVEAIGLRVWSSPQEHAAWSYESDGAMSVRFEEALDSFTAASLTERQREIVRLQL